jgi:hypothetical protein
MRPAVLFLLGCHYNSRTTVPTQPHRESFIFVVASYTCAAPPICGIETVRQPVGASSAYCTALHSACYCCLMPGRVLAGCSLTA